MANFVAIIDHDTERRTRYLAQVQCRIAPMENLVISRANKGAFSAVWAAGSAAPIRSCINGCGNALILGEAIEQGSARRVAAAALALRWDASTTPVPEAYDGFYAAVTSHRDAALIAGADLLGIFPVYYAATDQVVIVSSTPELIPLHPLFPLRTSLEGLVGILLTDALVDDRPLLEGIRRLRPGHAVIWQAGQGTHEVLQYALPISERRSTLSYRDQIAELDHLLDRAVLRHTPVSDPHGIMLSGGRDSRLLAGYLEQQARQPRAITMGGAGDHEVVCATRVAHRLGLDHHTTAPVDFARSAMLHATWDHLSSGFSSVHLWEMIEPLRALAPSFTNGYVADAITGGQGLKLRAREERAAPFELFFTRLNARGIDPVTLKRMLRPQHGPDVVDAVVDRLRSFYAQCSPLEEERVWRFQLSSTTRHRVGSIPWRLSFGSWPVLPILDRQVLDAAARLPAESVMERRAQDEILRNRFPHLARIAVVRRNVDLDRPLLESRTQRVGRRVFAAFPPIPWLRRNSAPVRPFNWNVYNVNSPSWTAIRQRAEMSRNRLASLFDLEALRPYLPPPDERVSLTFPESHGRKLILGLMLWSETHSL